MGSVTKSSGFFRKAEQEVKNCVGCLSSPIVVHIQSGKREVVCGAMD